MSCHQPTGHRTHPEAMDGMVGWGGQGGSKVTKVPIDESKIRRAGMERRGEGGVTGNEGICL